MPDNGTASRGQVFWACASTSAVLCGFAWVLRARAPVISAAALHTDPAAIEDLLRCTLNCAAAFACLIPGISCKLSLRDRGTASGG